VYIVKGIREIIAIELLSVLIMKEKEFFFVSVFFLGMMSVSEAQEAKDVGQDLNSITIPITKSVFYGFNVLNYSSEINSEVK
jgi:hypothetical protein